MKAKLAVIFIVSLTIIVSCKNSPVAPGDYNVMQLVFTRDDEIWQYDLLSKKLERLIAKHEIIYTNELGFSYERIGAYGAKWSPDGEKIVFLEKVGSGGANLKLLDLKTGEQQFFPGWVYRVDASPRWSVDGQRIIFAKSLSKPSGNYEVFIINADGTDEKQLTDRPFSSDGGPTLHFNGIDVLFWSDEGGIYHMAVYGDIATPVIFPDIVKDIVTWAVFSPVSDEILFGTKKSGSFNRRIWKMSSLEDQTLTHLTDYGVYSRGNFSNDGRKIVYVRYVGSGIEPFTNPEIWMMNADGTYKELIIKDGKSPDLWLKE